MLVAGFLLLAFLGPSDDASVNIATEAFGVVLGTYVTVGLVEYLRRSRERAEAEARRRRRLVSEFTANLSHMVSRYHDSAHARHTMLSEVRESLQLDPKADPTSQIPVSQAQRDLIIMGLMRHVTGDRLQIGALSDAVGSGAFLDVAPDGSTRPSHLHETLSLLLSDMRAFPVDSNTPMGDWWATLFAELTPRRGQYEAMSYLLVHALSYYDDVTNLFNGHVAVIRELERVVEPDAPRQRRPRTPFGAAVEQDIRSETVSPDEIEDLIRRGIYPFGLNHPREIVTATAPGLASLIIQDLLGELDAAGVPREHVSVEELKARAEKAIRQRADIAPPGIEIVPRSDDD
ncbi:MAG: hypothetical protein DK306_000310 [Chloroflexi bacterium]|nr:MAG: hypothetical protein DK306_000310 [Chloroflexota bacterium]